MTSRRDPLPAAGVIWCAKCRQETWPADATWLDDDLLLATFPEGCHNRERTLVITPSLLGPLFGRCDATTAAGTRCRNRPLRDGDLCYGHQRQQANRENA
jgi:hypothetical protein